MSTLYDDLIQEHTDVDAKLLKRFLHIFKKPDVKYERSFKTSLAKKLSKKIQEKKEATDNQILSTIPPFVKWRYRMTGFVAAMCVFLFVFILSFFSDFFGGELEIPQKYSYLGQESFSFTDSGGDVALETATMKVESSRINTLNAVPTFVSLGLSDSDEDSTETFYRFLYDGKKYPKISSFLPVYRRGEVLLSQHMLSSALANIKLGKLSLKKFPDLTFSSLQLVSPDDQNYRLLVDMEDARYSLYDRQMIAEIDIIDVSEKEVKKMLEKKMKSLGISLEGYGNVELELSDDGSSYRLFYPQLLNGYLVYDPLRSVYSSDRSLGIEGSYIPATDQLSLIGVDIAGYEVSNYPTFSKEEVMEKVVTGGDYFDGGSRSEYAVGIKTSRPQVVYLLSVVGAERYYVPALRFTVDSPLLSKSVFYVNLVSF